MATAIYIVCTILLMVIAFEDFRERMIHWIWLPLLAVAVVFYGNFKLGMSWQDWGVNFLFLLLLASFSGSYLVLVKKIKLSKITSTYLGVGDLSFFVIIALVFPSVVFLPFFVGSLLISLIYGIVLLKEKTIPLAGIQSLIMILVMSLFEWGIISVGTIENLLAL